MGDLAITMQWSVPPIGERPHQPISFRFPQRELGKKLDSDHATSRQTRVYSKPT